MRENENVDYSKLLVEDQRPNPINTFLDKFLLMLMSDDVKAEFERKKRIEEQEAQQRRQIGPSYYSDPDDPGPIRDFRGGVYDSLDEYIMKRKNRGN